MAKVRNNLILHGLSGMLGNQILIRQDKAGRTIVGTRPQYNPNRTFSEAQKEHRHSFREAAAYARTTHTMDVYIRKAAGTSKNPYNVAVADWFHAPEILDLDLGDWTGQPGKVLRIKALDDVLVTRVDVAIRSGSGATLEQGPASQVDGLWWEYTTTVSSTGNLTVIATAQDMPGNVSTLSKTSAAQP